MPARRAKLAWSEPESEEGGTGHTAAPSERHHAAQCRPMRGTRISHTLPTGTMLSAHTGYTARR